WPFASSVASMVSSRAFTRFSIWRTLPNQLAENSPLARLQFGGLILKEAGDIRELKRRPRRRPQNGKLTSRRCRAAQSKTVQQPAPAPFSMRLGKSLKFGGANPLRPPTPRRRRAPPPQPAQIRAEPRETAALSRGQLIPKLRHFLFDRIRLRGLFPARGEEM